jgi:hypothetical protein
MSLHRGWITTFCQSFDQFDVELRIEAASSADDEMEKFTVVF